MQTATKISALLAIRRDFMRDGLTGLEDVDALLLHYGLDPASQVIRPARKPDAARKNYMRRLVREALKDGPKPRTEIAAYVHRKRPELAFPEALHRTGQALAKMQHKGMVERVSRAVWRAILFSGPPTF